MKEAFVFTSIVFIISYVIANGFSIERSIHFDEDRFETDSLRIIKLLDTTFLLHILLK